MYLQVLTGYERASGPNHPSTLDVVNYLGILYAEQGMVEKAEGMYSRALEAWYERVSSRYEGKAVSLELTSLLGRSAEPLQSVKSWCAFKTTC
jgi:hypothetical protein